MTSGERGRRRLTELELAASRLAESPILVDGDADELLTVLRSVDVAAAVTDVTALRSSGQKARLVILAIDGDGRSSAFTKASRMLREIDGVLTSDAIRVVVVQSGRSRMAPGRLQRLLASEVLYQVVQAMPGPRPRFRSIRRSLGVATLDAAGLRILRFG